MALSDKEKEIFDNLVGGLYDEDADRLSENIATRKVVFYVILLLLGVALLITGAITKIIFFGIAGFCLMVYPVYRAGLKNFKTW